MLLPGRWLGCCHGFFAVVLKCRCRAAAPVIAVGLPCCSCCYHAGPIWPLCDLCPCRSCPPPAAGHWAIFTPPTGLLSTLLFLPLDSSMFLTELSHRSSTLSFSCPLSAHDFLLPEEKQPTVSASLCVLFALSVSTSTGSDSPLSLANPTHLFPLWLISNQIKTSTLVLLFLFVHS